MEEEKEFYFKTQNLSVGYNRKPILENISLGVYKGQILTLIGPNGLVVIEEIRLVNEIIP